MEALSVFSSGAMEARPTLEYQKIKVTRHNVEAPGQLPSWASPKSGPGTHHIQAK